MFALNIRGVLKYSGRYSRNSGRAQEGNLRDEVEEALAEEEKEAMPLEDDAEPKEMDHQE